MSKSKTERDSGRLYAYDWRDGNEINLLIDGGAFFPAMLDAIDKAQHSIVLAMYQVTPGGCLDSWVERLTAALGRGVAVHLLVDGFGGFPAREELRTLREAGAKMCWFNPASFGRPLQNLFRDHRKLLIIDEAIGFIGGFCLADEFDPRFTDEPWHDLALRIAGPVVADLCAEFERDWLLYGGEQFLANRKQADKGRSRCRLIRNHPRGIREVKRSAIERIESAEKRVWLVTPYFAPPRRLMRAIRGAAKRGVDVRVMGAGSDIDHSLVRFASWRYFSRLLRDGARIFEYTPRMVHMKCLLVDDRVSAGSCNLDHWELRWNRDANLEVDNREIAGQFAEMLQQNFSESRELSRASMTELTSVQRLVRWFASLVEAQSRRWAFRRQLRLIKKHPGRPRPGRSK